jgi:hypothetical protein
LKKITIGRDLGTTVEVLQGIDPQDSIVINPPDALEQGEEVKVAPDKAGDARNAPGTQRSKP